MNLFRSSKTVDPVYRMLEATVVASLSGIGTTTAILVKASVMHRTCLLPLFDLSGPNRSACIRILGPSGTGSGASGAGLVSLFLVFLAARASSDVIGDIQFQQWPPPRSLNAVHCSFNGAVTSQDIAVGVMK